MANKAYKFRIYPNTEQKAIFSKTFGCARMVYNYYLAKRKKLYQEEKLCFGYTKCTKDLALLKKERVFLQEVDSIALQQSLKHLDSAFQNFFRNKKFGYPKFKSKKKCKLSYSTICINGNVKIMDNYITLPKAGKVKAKLHRKAPDNYILKSATVSQDRDGKYYCSVLYKYEADTPKETTTPTKKNSIGLDYKTACLYMDSNGKKADMPKYYKESIKKLAKQQRKLSRKRKYSQNYHKQRKKVAKTHKHIANQRNDFLHKKSTEIANLYDYVFIEDVAIKKVVAKRKYKAFRRSTLDNGWYNFTAMLSYKLADRGKTFLKLDESFPSSQLCNECGYINPILKDDSIRKWECPHCHTKHDRDINAARNVLHEGLRLLA